jgi:predicted RND superfamily exporter protein
VLRSASIGLIAMIPNVIPVALFFGCLGWGAAPLSLPTSLIASIALGIAIDATAHYLVRYRAERLLGRSPAEAVFHTNRSVGRPIAIASVTLILGFAVVALSGFATLRQFGLLSAGTMAICTATDLVLLPAVLIRARI